MIQKQFLLQLLIARVFEAVPQNPPKYNGNLEYFIADISPGYPCHKNYN